MHDARLPDPPTLGQRDLFAFALVATVSFGALAWAQWLTPYMHGADGYFHIKVAWLTRTQGVLEEFPWAALSLWRERYFDKEFLFHVLLVPFTYGDLVTGAKWATVCLGTALLTSFYAVLRLRRVSFAELVTAVLVCGSAMWLFRLQLARPHILAITLTLWLLYALMAERKWLAGGLAVVYALSYTAVHVPVACGALAMLTYSAARGRLVWWPAAVTLAGVLLGWLLHPNFPNNFVLWWVQNVQVLGAGWGMGSDGLNMAGELAPADTRSLLLHNPALWAAVLGGVVALRFIPVPLGPDRLLLAAVTLGFWVLTALSKRFIEYSAPLSVWLAAEMLTLSLVLHGPVMARGRRAALTWAIALVALLSAVPVGAFLRDQSPRDRNPVVAQAAAWLLQNSAPGDQVFTCDWDDAPELFFYNHLNHYMVFLDPVYMYAWRAPLWRVWRDVVSGRDPNPVRTITQAFGARLGFCTGDFWPIRRQLEGHPRVLVQGAPGQPFVFKIFTQPIYPGPWAVDL